MAAAEIAEQTIRVIEQTHSWGDCIKHNDGGLRHCHCSTPAVTATEEPAMAASSTYAALIEAFAPVAAEALGETSEEARQRVADAATLVEQMEGDIFVDGEEYDTEEEIWVALLEGVEEDYSAWDAEQVATKAAALAGVPDPGYRN